MRNLVGKLVGLALAAALLLAFLTVALLVKNAGWPRAGHDCELLTTDELEKPISDYLNARSQQFDLPKNKVIFSGDNTYSKGSGWLVPFKIVGAETQNSKEHFGMLSCAGKVEISTRGPSP